MGVGTPASRMWHGAGERGRSGLVSGVKVEGEEAERRSRRYFVASCFAWAGLSALSAWMLHEWFRRLFNLTDSIAPVVAMLPGSSVGALVVWAALGTRPRLDPEQRRREAERTEPGRRRLRLWLIAFLGLMLLQQLVVLSFASPGGAPGGNDWGFVFVVVSTVGNSLTNAMPSRAGTLPEDVEFDQAERCEAFRVGYLVLVALGALAVAVSAWRPWLAGQAWAPVLLASALAVQIRMATLPSWVGRPVGEAG